MSIWMYCCSGCLRPPWGGMLATVPSSIFSSACCTPSPETSRVMRDVLAGLADLVDLVDVDDAALGGFEVVVGVLEELEEDVLDVLADVAGLGEGGGVADGEGDVEDAGQASGRAASCREPVGPISRTLDLSISTSSFRRRRRRAGSEVSALVVVVDGDGEGASWRAPGR